jgi:hypothetical protein
VTIAKRPSLGWDGGISSPDLGLSENEMFLRRGLDWANHLEPLQEIVFLAHAAAAIFSRERSGTRDRLDLEQFCGRLLGPAMTTAAKLLAQKQQLLERLQQDPGPNERAEIERLLEQINAALNLLDAAGPATSSDRQG